MIASYTWERVFFGVTAALGSGMSLHGAIVTNGEDRVVYVTLAVSIITAGFSALIFKTRRETMQMVTGRCGLSVLGGVFGRAWAAHEGWLKPAESVLVVGAQSVGVTLACFFVGFAGLNYLNRKKGGLFVLLLDHFVGKGKGRDE